MAARELGLTRQAVSRWPTNGHLSRTIADRVLATAVRKRVAALMARDAKVTPFELDAVTLPKG